MLLAIDVGNSDTTLGVLDRGSIVETWRMSTNAHRSADEHALMVSSFLALKGLNFDRNVTGVAIASVVPSVTQALREMVPRYFHFEPFVVEPGIRTGMPVLMDSPKEVGADRICGAVAAYHEHGGPAVIVDLGTATTFEAVSAAGEYLGGAIAPGLGIAADALFSSAAQLKRVAFVPPRTPVGKSTVEAIQSGLIHGYACLIEGMVDLFRKELGGDARTVLTGGLAEVLAPQMSVFDVVDPWLVLKGLNLLFDRNTS